MVGSTEVFSVGELRTLGFVRIGKLLYFPVLEQCRAFWRHESNGKYAVSFHDATACQTGLDDDGSIKLKASALAIGIENTDMPEEIHRELFASVGMNIPP